jgi:hypothetical protein
MFILVIRTSQAEQSLLPTLAAAIHQIDPGIVTAEGASMTDWINNSQSAYLHRSSAGCGRFCRSGSAAGRGWTLRRRRLFGEPENP